jgi:hypothetical protein
MKIKNGRVEGEPVQLADEEVFGSRPTWSPDGSSIAVVREFGADSEAWLLPVDGMGSMRAITAGAQALEVRATENAFAVCGKWGGDHIVCRFVDPEEGLLPDEPPLEFGGSNAMFVFDISADSKFVVFSRDRSYGDVWVLEGDSGTY